MSNDDDCLAVLLKAIQAGDDADDLTDSGMLAVALGWTDADVASCLGAAKDRSLIWGLRTGGRPVPCFADLEVTVQGHRFLSAHADGSMA